MRFQTLELIRYGKFTNGTIQFPKAEYDFHFIVGPNEAGKSTVRNAISELLFGIPRSSSMGFVHPQTDLRLGATIEHATAQLAFCRTKASKGTLRSLSDLALSDDVLLPFLGTADKPFFEQMFGLDHAQLVNGGQGILDASKDVGQVLFQSAAGIAGLGRVKDALAEEANKLWAPRKAGDRAYYTGLQRFEEASAELKEATVRTRAWSEAQSALEEVEARIGAEYARRVEFETTRIKLERVRRLAPYLVTLREKEAELAVLGEVLDLPADAAVTLSNGHSDIASTEEVLRHRTADVVRLQAELDEITFDKGILALRQDVEDLEAMSHRYRDHRTDLLLRQKEVDQILNDVKKACLQLEWPKEEELVRATLPTDLALRTITNLAKERGALLQAALASASAVKKKQRDIEQLQGELGEVASFEVASELRTSLSEAQTFRNSEAKQRTLVSALMTAEREVEDAINALGKWRRPIEHLREMALTSTDRLAALRNDRHALASAAKNAQERLDDMRGRAEATKLETEQFLQSRTIVTATEVRSARSERDEKWRAVKKGEISMTIGAPAVDAAIKLADDAVDVQLGSATEAAELQSLRQRYEREAAEVIRFQNSFDRNVAELAKFDAAWAAIANEMGLDGIPLDDVAPWLSRRDTAIAASSIAIAKREELDGELAACNGARELLLRCLQRVKGIAVKDGNLIALCTTAELYVKQVDAAKERGRTLDEQLRLGKTSLVNLQEDAASSLEAVSKWEKEWLAALGNAKLEGTATTVATAEAAVELVTIVMNGIQVIDAIRRDRIETMKEDLKRLTDEAMRLMVKIDGRSLAAGDASDVAKDLGRRLQQASNTRQEAESVHKELRAAQHRRVEAEEKVQEANARLKPLLDLANVEIPSLARPLVERSDKNRRIQGDVEAAREALAAGGDGLPLEVVAAEIDECDLATIQGSLEETNQSLTISTEVLTTASAERVRAEQAVLAISGHANAAMAEAKRQEALAAMVEATERYIKVATAIKLLRWAIDRYRERKQGPMLSRASAIFSQLTLGGFKKLLVDYDKEPLSLAAQRENGQIVEVPGMSEGTRDQLYLALRLAALELHLEHVQPLPFIADDLFVNFDDERARAGLKVLHELSKKMQVVFLSHHDHLVPIAKEVCGRAVNVVTL